MSTLLSVSLPWTHYHMSDKSKDECLALRPALCFSLLYRRHYQHINNLICLGGCLYSPVSTLEHKTATDTGGNILNSHYS